MAALLSVVVVGPGTAGDTGAAFSTSPAAIHGKLLYAAPRRCGVRASSWFVELRNPDRAATVCRFCGGENATNRLEGHRHARVRAVRMNSLTTARGHPISPSST